jgi:hypothetical protein
MARESLRDGTKMARFAGPPFEGRVVRVDNVGSSIPVFQMQVAWVDASGVGQTATTQAFKNDYERLKPGDPVLLMAARDAPRTVVLKRIYDNQGLVSLGTTQATPLIFFAAALLLGGAFLLATGNRFLGSDD